MGSGLHGSGGGQGRGVLATVTALAVVLMAGAVINAGLTTLEEVRLVASARRLVGAATYAANGSRGRLADAGGVTNEASHAAAEASGAEGEATHTWGEPRYVASEKCKRCHEPEYQAWLGSHHDLAMQPATDETVLADFGGTSFTHFGVTSRFFKKDGKFFVNTEGPDGQAADFEIKYTFGVELLQQYLVEFPGGRLQCLTTAWDTENRRWFHLYPEERVAHDDPLHWTGLYQNWNMMCADCHSTNLRKNYDAEADVYRTTWDEIDVGCDACHGPGSNHVEWAEARERGEARPADPLEGLTFRLAEPEEGKWLLDPETRKYKRSVPLRSDVQLETCAPCHSRRHALVESYTHGQRFLDTHVPARLHDPLYHADGQILDEVYVYASFVQSKMYRKGVRCSDCHDPHSLELYHEGNGVCSGCHLTDVFDTPDHHFHKADSTGALCVECHMPARKYMILDPRRDHAIRIPRPDLSLALGTPNACSRCHNDKSVEWAAEATAKWYGPLEEGSEHYGETIAAGHARKAEAESDLVALAEDVERPAIVRATALEILRGYGPAGLDAMSVATGDADPLVRAMAAGGLDRLSPQTRLAKVAPLLTDEVRAVRVEAARVLAALPPELFDSRQRADFDAALAEFKAVQAGMADTPSAHLNLGVLHAGNGKLDLAEKSYEQALRLDPYFLPASFNLANLYNQTGRNKEAERVLRAAIERSPEEGELHYSLGLLLAEQQRIEDAAGSLAEAAKLLPDRARVRYNYALTLQHLGRRAEAEAALLESHEMDDGDPGILNALALFYVQERKWGQALPFAAKLVDLAPVEAVPRQLMELIERELSREGG